MGDVNEYDSQKKVLTDALKTNDGFCGRLAGLRPNLTSPATLEKSCLTTISQKPGTGPVHSQDAEAR